MPRVVALLLLVAATAQAGRTFRLGGARRDYPGAIAADSEGNVYVAGAFEGTVDFDPGPDVAEPKRPDGAVITAFLAKYDRDGRLQWTVPLGGRGMNMARSVAVDGRGAVLVSGNFSGTADFESSDPPGPHDSFTTLSGRDAFVAKYGGDGRLLWVRAFGDEDHAPPGSKLQDVEWAEDARDLAVDAEGNVYVAGTFRGLIDLDPGEGTEEHRSMGDSTDAFLICLDAAGGYRWGFAFGAEGIDHARAVALGPDGTVVLAGCFSETVDFDPGAGEAKATSEGKTDAFLAWYGADGALRRLCTWGGYGIDHVADGALAVDATGAVYTAGEFKGKADFDPGRRRLVHGSDGVDAFVLRIRPDGKLAWVRVFGAGGTDSAHALCLDARGNVVVTGRFQKRVDFAPGRSTRILGAEGTAGASHAFVASYDARGRLVWAQSLGAKESGLFKLTRGAGLAAPPDGHVVALGAFFGTLDVDPGRKKLILESAGQSDLYVVRYDELGEPVP